VHYNTVAMERPDAVYSASNKSWLLRRKVFRYFALDLTENVAAVDV
jgi:hypothetical protein